MRRRVSTLRSRLLVLFISTAALGAIAFIIVQTESLRRSYENSRKQRDISIAQLVKLYIELKIPGDWQAKDGRLYKGTEELLVQEYRIRNALSEYLVPDTLIEFGVGTPPFPEAVYELGLRFEKPQTPFTLNDGAGIGIRDDDGRPVGWILVKSNDYGGKTRETRAAVLFLFSAALGAAVLIAMLSFLLLRLSKPIDVIAEARELAEKRNEILANMTKKDPLTGLLNRRGLEEAVADAVYRGSRPSHVAFVDIDHFKQINDKYGHTEGDTILVAVAGALAGGIRQQDICSRWGGEEFVLVMYGMSDDGMLASAERLREDIAGLRFTLDEESFGVTVTIGVAALGGHPLTRAMASADMAMYRGKRSGRNCVVMAGPEDE